MLHIEQVTDTDIICTVLNSGKIKTKKGVNVPGVHLSMPYLSQKDREDIIFGVQNGFDFIAASFVRTAQDVYDIRNLLNEYDSNIRIIAKIENREGVNNIDSILSAADAVMVARGDLGVEIDFTELPGIQKDIIDRSFSFGKPIVTATQMLDSMMVNPRPTRAEISDVANAIYDAPPPSCCPARPLPVTTPWRPSRPCLPLQSAPRTRSTTAPSATPRSRSASAMQPLTLPA